LEFVQTLGSYIQQKSYDEVLYVDETTFNMWQKTSKCWLSPGMKLHLLKKRGPSITVIGAISQERGLVHLELLDESNNASHFQHFLIGLKNKCSGRRVIMVLDNLRIHHAKMLTGIYDETFKEMFLPTYSSPLNPIEVLWSVVKRKWTKQLYHLTEELAQLHNTEDLSKRAMAMLRALIGMIMYS
jgi:transposase